MRHAIFWCNTLGGGAGARSKKPSQASSPAMLRYHAEGQQRLCSVKPARLVGSAAIH
jgi:hypothetical protein